MKSQHDNLPCNLPGSGCSAGASRRDILKAAVVCAVATQVSALAWGKTISRAAEKLVANAPATYVPGSARRLSQLTGDADPTGLSHRNHTSQWGVTGTDMGCPVEFKDRLYFLFGDVPTTNPIDLDPICFTTDQSISSGELTLSCINQTSGQFSPLTVDSKTLGTNETVTGAFTYNDRLYAFVVRGNSKPYSTLVSTADPAVSTNFTAHYEISSPRGRFWQVAPWVIQNARVPGLPTASGDGLLMWGQSGRSVYLAWMPLEQGVHPPTGIRFFGLNASWVLDQSMAVPVFSTNGVTQLSVTWLAGPRKWIALYTRASVQVPHESIVARVGENPWTWSDEIILFNPDRESAWGKFMHKPGEDSLDALKPERTSTLPGYAYSPFLLNRYTTWNSSSDHLVLTYLMATFVPYQVMLMQATLKIA